MVLILAKIHDYLFKPCRISLKTNKSLNINEITMDDLFVF